MAAIACDFPRDDRARADQAHRSAQHIEQLRQFIEAGPAQEAPDAGDAGVALQLVITRPFGPCDRVPLQQLGEADIGVDHHAAEFQAMKAAPAPPDAVVREHYRAPAGQPDRQRHRQHQRRQDNQRRCCTQPVDQAKPVKPRAVHRPPGPITLSCFRIICQTSHQPHCPLRTYRHLSAIVVASNAISTGNRGFDDMYAGDWARADLSPLAAAATALCAAT